MPATDPAAGFVQTVRGGALPRLPLRGSIDLTYRCNNNCRHCWLHVPANASEPELSLDEIRRIADEARAMGCREWSISGGEPMLRPDFPEIFDYLTRSARGYTLNTNGTLITPEIARLLTRKGSKLVALYGATAETHDHITRNPGSFDAAMRGFRHLREAGAGFTVQLIPMQDNYGQFDKMVELARSLSPHYRTGAPWLYLSACGSAERNSEITRQRLAPKDVIALDQPDPAEDEVNVRAKAETNGDDRLFADCIAARRDFHVDPHGGMTFCSFVKDAALRYDLGKGTFRAAWDEFIPALAGKVRGGREYLENCGPCGLRQHCRWCGVYGYLEHERYGARVEYLCQVARENRNCKEHWQRDHRRFYEIAGITLQVESDLPFGEATFNPKFRKFEKDGPGPDKVTIRHHFELPLLKPGELGQKVYSRPPWAIYRKGQSWVYLSISPDKADDDLRQLIVFNSDYSRGEFYHPGDAVFRQGNLHSLTLLPTDQILLAQLLADRQACFLHSAGAIVRPAASSSHKHTPEAEGAGILFVGHSEAGKSTMARFIQDRAEILCDDRNIVRKQGTSSGEGKVGEGAEPGRFRAYGSWSHGEVPLVSASSAPLRAILFIEQSPDNRLVPVTDRAEALKRLLACVVRPLETAAWWQKTLSVVEALAREVPCYIMEFDKSGRIVEQILDLAARKGQGEGQG
jgi:MoaA/NifB/PqqE/SkfB family radical SAM enzyme